jgi:hypothetical protein
MFLSIPTAQLDSLSNQDFSHNNLESENKRISQLIIDIGVFSRGFQDQNVLLHSTIIIWLESPLTIRMPTPNDCFPFL